MVLIALNFKFADGGVHSPGRIITQQEEDMKGKKLEEDVQETRRENMAKLRGALSQSQNDGSVIPPFFEEQVGQERMQTICQFASDNDMMLGEYVDYMISYFRK